MSDGYNYETWAATSRRRVRVLEGFGPFREGFFGELQRFVVGAAEAGIYGVSPLQMVEGFAGLFRFTFGPFSYVVVSSNAVLEAFEGADLLRARIALYFQTNDPAQPPAFIVEFGEAADGMVCDIGRTATGEWHDVAEFAVAAPLEDGVRAAQAVGAVIAATPAAWRRNVPWQMLAEEQPEVVQLANPLGFQPSKRR